MFDEAKLVLTRWFDAVNAGDLATVISMYGDDAVLLPTFSNKCLQDAAGRRGYFEKLTEQKELNVSLHEPTLVIQRFSTMVYSLSGIYCWQFMQEEEMLHFEARFTFTVDLEREKPVLHHHSSQVPRVL